MKLKYVEKNVIKTKLLENINLFYGKNGVGKSQFLNFLYNGFTGKGSDDFIIDGISVDKTLFNVTLLDNNFKYDDFLKFKSKGIMFKDYEELLLDDKKNEINEYLNKINELLNREVEKDFFNMLNENTSLINAKINVGIENFKNIYDEIFQIDFDRELTSSSKMELVLKYLILYRDDLKHNIFIIDDFDSAFDLQMTNELIEFMYSQKNCTFILSTSQTKSILKAYELKVKIYFDFDNTIDWNQCFKYVYLKEQFILEKEKDFDLYYQNNLKYITVDDLKQVFNYLSPLLQYLVNQALFNLDNNNINYKYANSFIEYLKSINNH